MSTPKGTGRLSRMNQGTFQRPMKKPKAGSETFSEAERAAMKARARELKSERTAKGKRDGETDLLDAVNALPAPSRKMAKRLHEIIKSSAPILNPKTWYGMPAYADADGKVVLFFRPAEKFKERYLTLGFNETAKLDDGAMWPVAYALLNLTPTEEKKIAALVKKVVR